MGPTWVLLAPDGPHVGPMNLAIREDKQTGPINSAVMAIPVQFIPSNSPYVTKQINGFGV